MTVTKALRRLAVSGRLGILTRGLSPVSCTGPAPRLTRSTSSPTRAMAGEPNTRSTCGARDRTSPVRSIAMQPITPMIMSGRACFSRRRAPSCEYTLSSHFSRIAHVLSRTRSASSRRSVSSYSRSRRSPATRSESYSFIWQPYVIRWSLGMAPHGRWDGRDDRFAHEFLALTVSPVRRQVKPPGSRRHRRGLRRPPRRPRSS
jgi:hypothetical protein